MRSNTLRIAAPVAVILIISGGFLFNSCQKSPIGSSISQDQRQVRIFLTDHQTPVFDSVFIDIQKLEVKMSDDSSGNHGWLQLPIRAGVYNILRLRNGIDTLFSSGVVPGTRFEKLRLTLGQQNRAVKNGQVFSLKVKDEDRQVEAELNSSNFEIDANGQVLFWIDFDVSRSIQPDNSGSGNSNGYRLRSHIKIFSRQSSGRIEGVVLPALADPIVKAITGSDTATAIPERNDGEYKLVGLNAGIYTVLFVGQNGFLDTTITNVIVRNNEDTHLPIVRLHQ